VGIMVEKIKRAKIVEYSIVLIVSIVIINAFPQTRSVVDKILETISTQVVSSLGGVEE
jgi:acetaldehyde dehydrogenase (acetylating)|tara:strand:+ start:250 stop:423 length:174 start_codon:yes stop_codon:yes gene_type:complete